MRNFPKFSSFCDLLLRIFEEFLVNDSWKFPRNSLELLPNFRDFWRSYFWDLVSRNSWKLHTNVSKKFLRISLEYFSGNSWEILRTWFLISRIVSRNSWEFLRNFSPRNSWEFLRNIAPYIYFWEILRTL